MVSARSREDAVPVAVQRSPRLLIVQHEVVAAPVPLRLERGDACAGMKRLMDVSYQVHQPRERDRIGRRGSERAELMDEVSVCAHFRQEVAVTPEVIDVVPRRPIVFFLARGKSLIPDDVGPIARTNE